VFALELRAAGRDSQIVAARGAVELHESRELERGILVGIGQGRTRVVVDLTEVTDVGPGLLGVLLRVRRGVTRVGGSLALVVAGPPVSDLVRTTLLGSLIQVADDRTRAMLLVGVDPLGIDAPYRDATAEEADDRAWT
jgi:anti-anti-sigma factor